MDSHPDLFSVQQIRERNPVLAAYCLGVACIDEPFNPEMSLGERLLYNMNHQSRRELVNSVFGDEDDIDTDGDHEMENREKEAMLVKMSRELFLAGKMYGIDYAAVDQFSKVCSTLSKEAQQDLEDAYFDASSDSDFNQ